MMVPLQEDKMDKKNDQVIDVEAREKPSALRAFLTGHPRWMDHWVYKLWAAVFLTYHGLKYAGVIKG